MLNGAISFLGAISLDSIWAHKCYFADFEEEARGGVDDHPKVWLTLVCCISAAGEKLPVLVIDTADWPYCFYDKGKTKKVIVFRQ